MTRYIEPITTPQRRRQRRMLALSTRAAWLLFVALVISQAIP